ncbi:hypothetical protein BJ165DRAFT_1530824 [Panaeolus papilionaceus]|nr:hypothetical protein BJ165DRAFT_1530824 [Panaeolus papilionaceus]
MSEQSGQDDTWSIPDITPVSACALSTFHLTVEDENHPTKRVKSSFDKSRGRVYKIDGDLYYSPNCSREGDFLRPSYWENSCTTYLAFVPLDLKIYVPPLDFLSKEYPIYQSPRGHWVDAEQVLALTRLEMELQKMINEVQGYFYVPEHLNVIVSAVAVDNIFGTRKEAEKAVRNTREWFAIWVGLLAYNIAVASIASKDFLTPDKPPTWWKYLKKTSLHPESILSSIKTSDLGGFHDQNRVGTFLDIITPSEEQPSVEFFHYFNVPVFYRWGLEEVKRSSSNPELQHLAPLPEQLQAIASHLVIQPSSQDDDILAPWKRHYQRCQEMREARIRTEDHKQRSTRLNREKNPRLSGIPIYIWKILNGRLTRCPSDDDTVEGYGVRQRFYNSITNEWDCSTLFGDLEPGEEDAMHEAEILIAESSSGWNLAAGYAHLERQPSRPPSDMSGGVAVVQDAGDMGVEAPPTRPAPAASSFPNVPSTTEASSSGSSQTLAVVTTFRHPPAVVPPELLTSTSSSSSICIAGPSRPTNAGTFLHDAYGQLQLEEYEIVDTLMRYFGFCPPLHFPAGIQPPEERSTFERIASDLGCSYNSEFFNSPIATLALDFWDAISKERFPNAAYWDLSPLNSDLQDSPRLQRFFTTVVPTPSHQRRPRIPPPPPPRENRKNPYKKSKGPSLAPPVADTETMYILDFGTLNTVSWRIAVFNVMDMHMVCRLPINFTERNILQELVDYDNYCAHARALLQNPRIARGALLAGGILWRIALRFSASLTVVTNGPEKQYLSFSYPSRVASRTYVFDELHPAEASALCGLYFIYKNDVHLEQVSWFPLPSTWASRDKHGFWTNQHENFFNKCLDNWTDLEHNIPLTATRWADQIRMSSTIRRVRRFITDKAKEFQERGT